MSDVDQVAEIEDELAGIVDPLVAKVAAISQEIETGETMVKLLRQKRTRLLSVIRSIDPSKAPSLYEKRKSNRVSRPTVIGAEKLEQVVAWLQEHRDELNANGGFRTRDLYERADFNFWPSDGAIAAAMRQLHKDGILRLDRNVRGRATEGRQTGKFFKVV